MISIKLLSNFIEITPHHGCSPVNLLHVFRTPFAKEHLWMAASEFKTLSSNLFEIWRQIDYFSNNVRALRKIQYLFCSQRKSTFILLQVFGICYPCHDFTYFNNKVCLSKKPLLVIEFVNFVTESLVFQNRSLILIWAGF